MSRTIFSKAIEHHSIESRQIANGCDGLSGKFGESLGVLNPPEGGFDKLIKVKEVDSVPLAEPLCQSIAGEDGGTLL